LLHSPPCRSNIREWSDNQAQRTLRITNILNGLLMVTAAIVLFLVGTISVSFTHIVISIYTV